MKKFPNNTKFKRPHKIKIIKGNKGIFLSRFSVGVRLKASRYLSYEQLETARRVITRLVKPKELKNKKNLTILKSTQQKFSRQTRRPRAKQKKFLYIRSNLCLPLTKKPLQVRMGKGKGSIDKWVFAANKSRVIFEMTRQRFKLRKVHRLLSVSRVKMPTKLKIIYHRLHTRRETNFVSKYI
uniref:Ribosomal protein L16 n=1 Tax=Physarum polycephalum TaxID=5791 RepID=F2Y9U1_PHYPO|nr:ribosomal protein L16 [Physarum polycephalum]